MNEQSVTKVNSIRSAELASRRSDDEAHNTIALPAQRKWIAAGGGPQMFGDGMLRSSSDVNQGTTAGGERAGRGQSPRSSQEAGNDRGAKGGRDVVWVRLEPASQRVRVVPEGCSPGCTGKPGLKVLVLSTVDRLRMQVSGAQACAAGAIPPKPGVECLSQSIGSHGLESWMRENRPSSLGGGRRSNPFSIHIRRWREDLCPPGLGVRQSSAALLEDSWGSPNTYQSLNPISSLPNPPSPG
jgi:hypothetical protein